MFFNPPVFDHPFAGYAIGKLKQIGEGHFVLRVDENVLYSLTKYGTNNPEFELRRYEFPSRYHHVGIVKSSQLPARELEKFEAMIVRYVEQRFCPQN